MKKTVLPLTRASCDPTLITVVPNVWVSPAKAMLSTSLPSATAKILIMPPVFSVGGASKVSASSPSV